MSHARDLIACSLVKAVSKKKIHVDEAKVLVLGFTFKGDCPDVRNTKVIDVVNELKSFNMQVDVCDSWADPIEVEQEYGIKLTSTLRENLYDAILVAVDHSEYKELGESGVRKYGKEKHVLYDVKYVLGLDQSDLRL